MKITTIKLQKTTRDRLNRLKRYKRETYDDLIQDILQTLNTCRINPEKARLKLIRFDRERRSNQKSK